MKYVLPKVKATWFLDQEISTVLPSSSGSRRTTSERMLPETTKRHWALASSGSVISLAARRCVLVAAMMKRY